MSSRSRPSCKFPLNVDVALQSSPCARSREFQVIETGTLELHLLDGQPEAVNSREARLTSKQPAPKSVLRAEILNYRNLIIGVLILFFVEHIPFNAEVCPH